VTGTPVGSDIADLKGQFNFLQLHPFTNKNFFSVYVKPAYTGSTWARPPASMLLCVLSQCMIRHTKLQVSLAMTPTPTMAPTHAMTFLTLLASCSSVALGSYMEETS